MVMSKLSRVAVIRECEAKIAAPASPTIMPSLPNMVPSICERLQLLKKLGYWVKATRMPWMTSQDALYAHTAPAYDAMLGDGFRRVGTTRRIIATESYAGHTTKTAVIKRQRILVKSDKT
jgi:hypothetical protein